MYLSWDLETGSTEFKGRKGSPWANKILAIGLKYYNTKVISLSQDYMPKSWLDGVKVLIGHNIKFDLLHTWRNEELQNYFKNGGKIWDTQLAEYILTGQQSKFSALRDIGVHIYGCNERTKKIEEGIKAGINTADMDIEDLLYDVRNDVLDTEKIALQQLKIAKQQGMYNLIREEMDSLLATTEMEYNGLYVNRDVMIRNKLNLQIDYEHKLKQLQKICLKHWS